MPTNSFVEAPDAFKGAAKTLRRPSRTSTPNAKRVLTLRMLAAQTEWLEGPPSWHEGRVVWTHSRGTLAPGAADLSAAQRALHQVARYPRAGNRAFGDGAVWLAVRQARLEEAKRLHALHAPDLPLLCVQRSEEALLRMVELLPAEALCLNALPASPSRALVRIAKGSPELVTSRLAEMVADEAAPRAGRALAALVLGAASGENALAKNALPEWEGDTWMARAHQWGTRRGLPAEPGLAVALLAGTEGTQLLRRWQSARQAAGDFSLPVESLREMLFAGTEPERVVALCERLAEVERVAARLQNAVTRELNDLAARFEIPEGRLHSWRDELREHCREQVAALAKIARDYALATTDPEALRWLAAFVGQMLDWQGTLASYLVSEPERQKRRRIRREEQRLSPSGRPYLPDRDATASLRTPELLWESALRALKAGQILPPSLAVAYLRLLTEEGTRLLEPQGLHWGRSSRTLGERRRHLQHWARRQWTENGQPLVSLLKRSGDPALCREAMRAGVHQAMGKSRFRDAALYNYALETINFLEVVRQPWKMKQLCEVIACFGTIGEARASLGPLLEALRVLPPAVRSNAFRSVHFAVGSSRHGLRTTLPRLAPHFKTLFIFLARAERCDDLDDHLDDGIEALLGLKTALRVPPQSVASSTDEVGVSVTETQDTEVQDKDVQEDVALDDWLTWLLKEAQLAQKEREAAGRTEWFPLGLTTRLCAQLANDDFEQFQHSFRAVARLDVENTRNLERGLDTLRRYPMLRATLAETLAEQPTRVFKLLARLGLTPRLGADALRPLQAWKTTWRDEPAALAPDELPADWQNILALAPELAPLIADFLWSRRMMAESASVPASVRRALQLPSKLEGELAHLERMVAQLETPDKARPDQTHLLQRAATLRARLSDSATLRAQAISEAREKMQNLAREARLRTGERSVENCFRAQLQFLVGHLPPTMALDDDWFNAVLLAVDIPHNRKLLRHLLRALASGDTAWRDRQPGNIAFLRGLEERGVNVAAWNGEHRKRYACAELPGTRVHLRVERNPLQIFQMGNAFGTCLSVGDINAFSTVANACEANKCVVFARDGQGRIVARKLLAINDAGGLVGFHTYASGPSEATNTALRSILNRYAREFAARCGLALSDTGDVPLLFAEEWYDDGILPWADAQAKPPTSKPVAGGLLSQDFSAT